MDLLGGADGSRHGHLLHAAVGSGADSDAGGSQVGEHERPQLRILAKEVFGCHSPRFFCRRTGVARNKV